LVACQLPSPQPPAAASVPASTPQSLAENPAEETVALEDATRQELQSNPLPSPDPAGATASVSTPKSPSRKSEKETAKPQDTAKLTQPSDTQDTSPSDKEQVNKRGISLQDGQPDDLWQRIRENLSWQQTESVKIDKARAHYLKQSNYLPMMSERADYYLYYIVEEVQKRNMPVEIALIPMIESTLDPFATGPSGAAGLWQIMPKTGSHLGLEQDSWYDGRQSVRDSTKVALDYLETLHKEFGEDWFLALAAYNSGAGNVARAQQANRKKGLNTDYWSLKLPRHTTNYVPKLIALAQIVAEPERFDVSIPAVDNAPSFEVVDTGTRLQLTQAAKLAEVDVDTLRALNAGQLRETIAPSRPQEILVPVGTAEIFEYNISKLSPEQLVQWKTYRIQPGDNLGRIAQKFDIDVAVLQDVNSLHGSSIQAGDTLKIPGDGALDLSGSSKSSGDTAAQDYRVRKGDSLHRIAGKFKVSIDDIVAWNALDPGAYLKPGQELKLYLEGS
jgi:peptidoglycan lytic transglycosylase D